MALSKIILISIISLLVSASAKKILPTPYCDFETGFCLWTQATDDQFNWTRTQGPTSSSLTGPTNDHTLGTSNGWYIYMEASSPRRPEDRARILSPTINDGKTRCLSFWYHMNGIHINRLNVYRLQGGSSTLGTAIWTRNGTQGTQWKQANTTIRPLKFYQIVFEGVRGVSYQGDIALDDIRLLTGSCSADVHLVSHGKDFNEALTCPLPQVTRRPLALQHKQYCKRNGLGSLRLVTDERQISELRAECL